jgi:hypothetical protein
MNSQTQLKRTTTSILTVFCLTFLVVSHRVEAVELPHGNTAEGNNALNSLHPRGVQNTAIDAGALSSNTIGGGNTATGFRALIKNVGGDANTAVGIEALKKSTGSDNVALGSGAGEALSSGSGNVYIGAEVFAGESFLAEDNTTRIRNVYASLATGRAVYVNSDNKIGTVSSSRLGSSGPQLVGIRR